MTFRAVLAGALVAAAGLACSDAPSSQPTSRRLAVQPKKLGSYTMTVTPLPELGSRRARVDVVPDLKDGNPDTNPGGSVQVAGRFFATIEPANGNGCAGQSLGVPLSVTNFAAEQLVNVQVQITSMSKTGFEVCRVGGGVAGNGLGDPALLPAPASTRPGAALGLGAYGSLGGVRFGTGQEPRNDGSAPGGTRALTWWFKFPSNTPVTFTFVVWADPQQPEIASAAPELEIGQPLTWTSAGSSTTRLELCTVDPFLTDGRCPPASLSTLAPATTTGTGPWGFSAVPATADGATYHWRAVNTYSGLTPLGAPVTVAGNYPSPWDTFTAVAPLVAAAPTLAAPLGAAFPADSIATATPILLQWDTAANITDAVYQICTGPCPVPFDPLDPNAANLVVENVETWVAPAGATLTGYEVDVSGFLPTDPLTGDAWLLPASYTWRVWNLDAASGATVGTPSESTFTIAPVSAVAPEIVSPLPGDQYPADSLASNTPVLIQWTTDPAILTSQIRLCDTATCLPDALLGLSGVLYAAQLPGVPPVAGAPNEYALDALLLLPTDPNAGFAWLLPGFYFVEVDNVVGGLAQGVPVTSSFEVVSSMPALPVQVGPAAGAGFLQNSLVTFNNASGYPIPFAWTSVPEVVTTWLEVCTTVDCLDPVDPLLSTAIGSIPVTGLPGAGLNDYAADAVADALLFSDLGIPGGSNGAYLETGTFYWRLYNEDQLSLAVLYPPGPARAFTIDPFSPGFAAAAGNPASPVAATAGTYVLGWTGHGRLSASTVEVCGALGCQALPAFSATPGGAQATFSMDLFTLVPPDALIPTQPTAGTYTWKVIDDDVYLAYPVPGDIPVGFWTTLGTFTIQ